MGLVSQRIGAKLLLVSKVDAGDKSFVDPDEKGWWTKSHDEATLAAFKRSLKVEKLPPGFQDFVCSSITRGRSNCRQ